MKFIKHLVVLTLFVITVLAGLWFAMENTDPVRVSLWGYHVEALSLGVLLPLALFAGLLLGVMVSLLPWLHLRGRLLRSERKREKQGEELKQLRLAGVKADL